MSYRLAESLIVLRDQLNKKHPKRSKVSDGWIGDASHQSRSNASDHNPHIKDKKGVGVVTAFDFTHDPINGIDCNLLAGILVQNKDPRIKYIIWNRQIVSSKQQPWKWRGYTGVNAHKHHLHISVDPVLYDDKSEWNLSLNASIADPLIKYGARGEEVRGLQRALVKAGILRESEIDGVFGNETKCAVMDFQRAHKLTADGIVGAKTREQLGL